jgi:hypothetical protein
MSSGASTSCLLLDIEQGQAWTVRTRLLVKALVTGAPRSSKIWTTRIWNRHWHLLESERANMDLWVKKKMNTIWPGLAAFIAQALCAYR